MSPTQRTSVYAKSSSSSSSRPLLAPLPFPLFPSLLPFPPLLSLPFSSLPSRFAPPLLPSFPFPLPLPGGPNPLTAARGSGGALKLPQRVRAEPGRHQAVSGAFCAKKSNSGYSNVALRLMLVKSHFLFKSGILLSLRLHLAVKTE